MRPPVRWFDEQQLTSFNMVSDRFSAQPLPVSESPTRSNPIAAMARTLSFLARAEKPHAVYKRLQFVK